MDLYKDIELTEGSDLTDYLDLQLPDIITQTQENDMNKINMDEKMFYWNNIFSKIITSIVTTFSSCFIAIEDTDELTKNGVSHIIAILFLLLVVFVLVMYMFVIFMKNKFGYRRRILEISREILNNTNEQRKWWNLSFFESKKKRKKKE